MTVAEALASALRDAGVTRMFGLPGGEILDFIDAARRAGIEFILVRHEATASFMADALGRLERRPAVCVSTLGPGAVNMTLGVANAFLDRSPVVAITASLATTAAPYATHQNLDLEAVYRPFTKATLTLDGRDTATKTATALRVAMAPRMGPVHLALPADLARERDVPGEDVDRLVIEPPAPAAPAAAEIERMATLLRQTRRPVLLVGLDLEPLTMGEPVRRLAETLGAPVFVTPKAKGLVPEDHPLFCGVCAGVGGDSVIVDFLAGAERLVGLGFDPVESDKIWHQTIGMVSIGPLSIAAGAFRPAAELVGDFAASVDAVLAASIPRSAWTGTEIEAVKTALRDILEPAVTPTRGVSPFHATRRLRQGCPRDTIATTDVGSVKFVVSQAWTTWDPLTFLESNGLSAMGYALPAAMAAKLRHPDRPVLCTVGDGGFAMTMADLETCVRLRLAIVVVVFNDNALSLIRVAQARRGQAEYGVSHGPVDFAAVAAGLGAWSARAATLGDLDDVLREAWRVRRPAVIDLAVDPGEYHAHAARPHHE